MAATFPVSKREEFKDNFLTCSICFEPYDTGTHQAKCLPCLHTYCKSCLESVVGKGPTPTCPECRKDFDLPGGTVDSLPNNFLVENLREYQDLINQSVVCGDCDDGLEAASFCKDCHLFLCRNCVDVHKNRRSQRHHQLSTMQELQQQKHPRNEQVCQKHPAQTLNLYCKEVACRIQVCASCKTVDHHGHELVDSIAAINEIVAEIKQFSAKLNGRNQELAERREIIKAQQNKLAQNSEQKTKDINELEMKLINCIKSRCYIATTHIKQLRETENKRLTVRARVDRQSQRSDDQCLWVCWQSLWYEPSNTATNITSSNRRKTKRTRKCSTSSY